MYEIEKFSMTMIDELIQLGATDIHLIPLKEDYEITFRQSGELFKWRTIKKLLAVRLISHFKYRSSMDIGERRKPQSASMLHQSNDAIYSLRLSTLPTRGEESLAIRILPQFMTTSLHSIAILPESLRSLFKICALNEGLCLFSGPTGAGKSTTLYALIEQLLQERKKTIITIEDPIERLIQSIIQIEVNKKAGITFDEALKASLRHDPDVILIGEIRDKQTALLAVRAALTGHLVLATVHASSASSTLLRMLDLGVSRVDLLTCLRYVVSQRLVRRSCPFCEGECSPYCHKQKKRGAVFEFLTGDDLIQMINDPVAQPFPIQYYLNKAWLLGAIPEHEVWREFNV